MGAGVGAVVLLMVIIIVITCIGTKGRKRNKKRKQLNYYSMLSTLILFKFSGTTKHFIQPSTWIQSRYVTQANIKIIMCAYIKLSNYLQIFVLLHLMKHMGLVSLL